MGVKVTDNYYHGECRFYEHLYKVDEIHDPLQMIGKWCISVQIPGVNHTPKIFTFAVRGYDNEPNNDELNNKRPVLFYTEKEVTEFCNLMYFPKQALRIHEITNELVNHKLFIEMGAYLAKRSDIIIPKRTSANEFLSHIKSMGTEDENGGIILP